MLQAMTDWDGEILIACAWADDESHRKFEMFPEFIGSDTTEGTHREKRPLITHCGKDSNNQTFTHRHALLPSKSCWVFDWFFSCAVPGFLPSTQRQSPETLSIALINATRSMAHFVPSLVKGTLIQFHPTVFVVGTN